MPHIHNALHRFTQARAAYQVVLGELTPEFTGIERAGETITPVLDLWSRPEWAILRGEIPYAMWRTAPAVAAEFSAVALVNPATTRILAIVDACSMGQSAALQARLFTATEAAIDATLGTILKGNRRDTRLGNTQSQCELLIGSDASADFGEDLEDRRVAVAEQLDFRSPPIILQPGFGLVMGHTVVNTAVNGWFKWREISGRPDELD